MHIAPAAIPSPPLEWSFFSIGPLTFHTYAIIIVAGMVLAVVWTNHRLVKRGAEPWVVIDVAIPAILLGLLGARLYHVVTHPADYFYDGADFWRIFAIWEGGNAIIGALIGGAIGVWLGCRIKGIRFFSFADATAPTILAAQALGRLGNWFNHELFGWPTDLPWGLEIPPTNSAIPVGLPAETLFHPTFLYELLWNLVGVGVILVLERMFRMRWGKTLAVYLIWYGLGRMMIESIRVDYSEIILGMRSNVFGALIMVLIGIAVLIVQLRRHKDVETSVYVDGRQWSETADEADATLEGSANNEAANTEEKSNTETKEEDMSRDKDIERADQDVVEYEEDIQDAFAEELDDSDTDPAKPGHEKPGA